MTIYANDEQLIGSILPDPYVRSVTLESRSVYPVPDAEVVSQVPIFGQGSSAVSSSKPLTVTLEVVLKDLVGTNAIESWFFNEDFKQYLNIIVVQSIDPSVTEVLAAGRNILKILQSTSEEEVKLYVQNNLINMPIWKQAAENPNFEPSTLVEDTIAKMNGSVSLQTQGVSINTDPTQESTTTTFSGEKIIDLTYRFMFEAPNDTPQHLSYFVMTSIDLQKIAQDFNINSSDISLLDTLNSKTTLEKVIEGSNLVSEAFIFRDEDDLIWTGPVSQTQGGAWFGGLNVPNSPSVPLTREVVSNNKIQDFRVYDRIERLQLDLSYIENSQFNKNLSYKTSSNDHMDVSHPKNYFSDLYVTSDANGFRRFQFVVDYEKIIKEHSKYGALCSGDNAFDILNNVRIRNISFLRRRVTRSIPGLNRLGSPQEDFNLFDINTPDTVIARGHEKSSGQKIVESFTPGFGGITEVQSLFSPFLNEPQQYRSFEAMDLQISSITDGYYQYGIEIEVQDNTEALIAEKVELLLRAKNILDVYYNNATTPYNPRTGVGNFDTANNRFTSKFIEAFETLEDDIQAQMTLATPLPGVGLIDYVDTLLFFNDAVKSGASDAIDLLKLNQNIVNELYTFIHPRTGTPRGILMIIKLIENLMTRLARAIGVSPGLSPDGTTIGISGKPIFKTFKIQHYFPNVVDSNEPKGVGYDYILFGDTDITGLNQISLSEYKERVNQESLKFYNSLVDDNIDLSQTQMTYLSPSGVNLASRGKVDLMNDPFDPEKNLKIQTTLTGLNLTKMSPHLPLQKINPPTSSTSLMTKPQLEIKADLISAMASFNCTFELENDLTQVQDPSQPSSASKEIAPYTDAGAIMGEEYEQVDQPTEKPDSFVTTPFKLEGAVDPTSFFAELLFSYTMTGAGSYNFFSDKSQSKPLKLEDKKFIIKTLTPSFYKLAAPDARTSGAAYSGVSMDNKDLALLPNQLKSLFFKSEPGVRYNWDMNKSLPILSQAAFILNYKSLKTVEVLTGYNTGADGRPMLNDPIWAPLTNDLINSMSEKRLCRLKKYENKELGCIEAVGMRMPVYNEYFMLVGTENNTPKATMKRIDKIKASANRVARQLKYTRPEFLSTGLVSADRVEVTTDMKRNILKQRN